MLKKVLILLSLPSLVFICLLGAMAGENQRRQKNYCDTFNKFTYNLDSDGTQEGNKKAIWSFFRTVGFSPEATAGIMGNLYVESHFDPAIIEAGQEFKLGSTGFGIAQWTTAGRQQALFDYAKSQNKKREDLGMQLDFLYNQEFMKWNWGNYFSSLDELKGSNSVANVTKAVMLEYERPKDQSPQAVQGRISHSEQILKDMKSVNVSQVTISRKLNDGRVIWVGDSRFVGMENAKKTDKDIYIAKESQGYDWFTDTAIAQVNDKVKKGDTIVFGLGINDLDNVDKYVDKLNELKKNEWKAYKVIVLSVNPVNDEKSSNVKNEQIEKFNETISSKLIGGIEYLNTYLQIKDGMVSDDGVHYDKTTYEKIYDIVRSRGTSTAKHVACANYSIGGDSKLNGKPKFDLKIWKSSDNPYLGLEGQCTWFVWGRLKEVYGWAPSWSAMGYDWVDNLTKLNKDRYKKADKPVKGSIFSSDNKNGHNHVGIIVDIKGDTLIVQEANLNNATDDWTFAIKECTNGETGEKANGDWWQRELTLSQLKEHYGEVTFANPVSR